MKRYVFGILAGAACILLLQYVLLFNVRAPIPAEYWLHDVVIVKRDLLKHVSSPRIIFTGGSSTLFGIDAVEVEHELKRPAFNCGFHAGMRLQELLDLMREQARPGDVVVLALEYTFFVNDSKWSSWQLRNSLAFDPMALDKLPFLQRVWLFTKLASLQLDADLLEAKWQQHYSPAALVEREAALRPPDQILQQFYATRGQTSHFAYSMENIDDHGDILNTDNGPGYLGEAGSRLLPDGIAPDAANELSRFLAEMQSRQVRVFFTNTPYLVEETQTAGWRQSEAKFESDCARIGAKYIDHRRELFFSRDLFFNTPFHLNAKGRALRTRQLVEHLRVALANPEQTPTALGQAKRATFEVASIVPDQK